MSWLSKFFGGNSPNPANSAMDYLNQIPSTVSPYYQPYINQGQEAGNSLIDQYKKLTENPADFYSSMGAGYKESPGYQFKLKNALQAGQNASAAGGMLGTPQDVQQQSQIGNDIASQDYEEYINHILGLYGLGQQGQQKLQEQGFNASTGLGDNLGNVLGQKAQYGYAGQAAQNANKAQNWSNLFQLGGAAGGALMGGLPGAYFGSNLFK